MQGPAPLSALPKETIQNLRGVFTDIDDTLTTKGTLTASAYRSLEALHDQGIIVIPVTGRPAGWADHIARMWPVDGIVAENGGLYMRHVEGQMIKCYQQDDATRRENKTKLTKVCEEILSQVPGSAVSSDQPYRELDLSIDYCEDIPALSDADVDKIVEIFENNGATAKVSSIHVNGWFGNYSKLEMLKKLMLDEFNIDLDDAKEKTQFIYCGDSPNDEPMFSFFPLSVGVANIDDFEGRLKQLPTYKTHGRCGEGFQEIIEKITAIKKG